MAAVLLIGGKFYWTRWNCSESVWNLLTYREDSQIWAQEALAVILGMFSWHSWLEGAAVTIYADNEGVRYALISGTSRCKEIALLVARMWHEAARSRCGLLFRRVESKANLADGPTRDDFKHLEALQARWLPPELPQWIDDLWEPVLVSGFGLLPKYHKGASS